VTGTKKPRKLRMSDEGAHVAYITGIEATIAKMTPLKLCEGNFVRERGANLHRW